MGREEWAPGCWLKGISSSDMEHLGELLDELSLRSWSSCSIAAMRRLKSENLETEITSARIDSGDVIRLARDGATPPRLRLAPLTILSPGPRLAGNPRGAKENNT
jgi:hypothetical protein